MSFAQLPAVPMVPMPPPAPALPPQVGAVGGPTFYHKKVPHLLGVFYWNSPLEFWIFLDFLQVKTSGNKKFSIPNGKRVVFSVISSKFPSCPLFPMSFSVAPNKFGGMSLVEKGGFASGWCVSRWCGWWNWPQMWGFTSHDPPPPPTMAPFEAGKFFVEGNDDPWKETKEEMDDWSI